MARRGESQGSRCVLSSDLSMGRGDEALYVPRPIATSNKTDRVGEVVTYLYWSLLMVHVLSSLRQRMLLFLGLKLAQQKPHLLL